MRLDDFDYHLPEELIAQSPAAERRASRLLHLDGANGALQDLRFTDLPGLLRAGELQAGELQAGPLRPGPLQPGPLQPGKRLEHGSGCRVAARETSRGRRGRGFESLVCH